MLCRGPWLSWRTLHWSEEANANYSLHFIIVEYWITRLYTTTTAAYTSWFLRVSIYSNLPLRTLGYTRSIFVLLWTPSHGRAKAGRPAWTYIQHLCEDMGCSPEDLPEAMNDREEWRERARDIRAGGMTWWWWWKQVWIQFSFSLIVSIPRPKCPVCLTIYL